MYQIMFYAGLALTLVFLVLSIVFFVRNNVAKIIGDVTGWNARKAIKEINRKGAEEKSKTEAIKSNVSKVLVRDEDSSSQKNASERENDASLADMDEEATTLLQTGDEETTLLADEETTLLQTGDEETTLLQTGDEETTLLQTGDEETTLLQSGDEETTLLTEDATTLLQSDDEETTVLTGQGFDSVSTGVEETVVVADESTSILNQVMDYSAMNTKPKAQQPVTIFPDEQAPVPDIFEVEEEAMVVHTDENIK